MRIIIISLFFLAYQATLHAQNKRDYYWITGRNTSPEPGIDNYVFDFNETPFVLQDVEGGLHFDNMNISMCDPEGNLLFYSNGCAVANRDHEIMPNGEDINEGDWFDIFWGGDCKNGYPGTQDILALPDPANEEGYYLISKPTINNPTGPSFLREMQYSYVNMSLDGGKGDLTEKNQVFYSLDTIQSSYLQAVKHANDKDWWIVQPVRDSSIYLTFLLDNTGIKLVRRQDIGDDFHWNAGSAGNAKFSPDGTKYAYFNTLNQLRLFDFDRQTGLFSNLEVIHVRDNNNFSAIEFSPSGNMLYFSTIDILYQLELSSGELILIDEWNGISDPFPTIFFLMQRAPDCKIYMCSTSSTNTYHVIHKPDEKGVACDFEQQGIALPHTSSVANFPNFPNFRIDEDEVCDPTITSVFNQPVIISKDISLYPNPVSVDLRIETSNDLELRFVEVHTLDGRMIDRIFIDINSHSYDMSDLQAGVYVLKFHLEGGGILTKKVVKM